MTGEGPLHWFEPIADDLGDSYLRYAHTKGTRQEVDHLVAVLGLVAGMRVLDVGCGPGRHSLELARRGVACHGVDVSQRFVELATVAAAAEGLPATFERSDARDLATVGEYDAVICLCQGGFGMMRDDADDRRVVDALARALRPGGVLALSAFSAYFAVRYHDGADFDAAAGVAHERTTIHPDGAGTAAGSAPQRDIDLWTGCYTPRELRLLAAAAGLTVERLSSVEPGAYGDATPTVELAELLLIARRRPD